MTKTNNSFDGCRWHDMGGDVADPIPKDQHDFSLWEKRIDALMVIASAKGLLQSTGCAGYLSIWDQRRSRQ